VEWKKAGTKEVSAHRGGLSPEGRLGLEARTPEALSEGQALPEARPPGVG